MIVIYRKVNVKLKGDKLINNGRIYNADYVTTVMTDVDLWIVKMLCLR